MAGFVEASRLSAAQERADKAEREAVRLRAQTERLQEEAGRLQVRSVCVEKGRGQIEATPPDTFPAP